MPFTLPNATDPTYGTYPDMTEPDSGDFSIIAQAHNGFSVQSGCAASVTGTDLNVTIASGFALVNGVRTTVAGNTVAITTGNATNPRIDLIVVDSTGVAQRVGGTASANAVLPTWNQSTQTVLYEVYMPATSTIVTAAQVLDKRVLAQQHTGDAHTGDVIPNNTDQVMGTGTLTLSRKLESLVTAPATISDRVIFDQHYTSQAGTGLTAKQMPRIVVKDVANKVIPVESPAYGIADYIIFKDSTNCYARNVRTSNVDFVGTSLHAVHNAAASATVNGVSGIADGTATDLTRGIVIYLSTPDTALAEYTTDASLQMQMGETLAGPGPAFKIRPSSTFPSGGLSAANAIVDAYTNEAATPARIVGRTNITGLTIDGKTPGDATQPLNLIGILQRRPDNSVSPAGGDFSKTTIWNNEIYNFDGVGISIGLGNITTGTNSDPGTNHATSNTWLYANNCHDGTSNSAGIAAFVGDLHIGEGHQCQSNNGIPLYIAASSVHVVGESHYGLQGSTNTHACVWIASGTNTKIVGAYFDNIVSPGIPGIYTAGSRTKVMNSWFNAGQIGTDLSVVGVRIDGAAECMVQNNQGAANNSTLTAIKNWKAIVEFVGGAGSTTGAKVEGNSFLFCKNVYNAVTAAPTFFTNKKNKVTYDASNSSVNYNSYFSDNDGATGSIASGATVAHQLDRTPVGVIITPAGSAVTSARVSALAASNFTISSVGGSAVYYWRAWT